MALFGNCFSSRHAVIAACYRDEYATNFNLASGCKYKVFAASTRQLLKTCAASALMVVLVSAGGPSSRKAVAVQVGAKTKKECRYSCQKKRDTGKNVPRCYLSWLATLTLVDPREQ